MSHFLKNLHHLFRVGKMLGPQALSVHNLTHYFDLMKSIRKSLDEGTFEELYRAEKARWNADGGKRSAGSI